MFEKTIHLFIFYSWYKILIIIILPGDPSNSTSFGIVRLFTLNLIIKLYSIEINSQFTFYSDKLSSIESHAFHSDNKNRQLSSAVRK